MPFTFLAHQAPVIPLKLAFPRRFCGIGLALGSMAPDLEYFLRGELSGALGHTIGGQLYFCLPLTLLLTWVIRRVVAAPVAAHLPARGPWHLADLALLARPTTPGDWLKTGLSALVGSFSHLFVDGFTHWNGWATTRVPLLQRTLFVAFGRPVPTYKLLQHLGSLVLALVAVALVREILRRRLLRRWSDEASSANAAAPASSPSPTRASHLVLWGPAAATAVAGGLVRFAQSGFGAGLTELWMWGHLVLQIGCFFFVGLAAGSVLAPRLARSTVAGMR